MREKEIINRFWLNLSCEDKIMYIKLMNKHKLIDTNVVDITYEEIAKIWNYTN